MTNPNAVVVVRERNTARTEDDPRFLLKESPRVPGEDAFENGPAAAESRVGEAKRWASDLTGGVACLMEVVD
jgi:hypothetical protein